MLDPSRLKQSKRLNVLDWSRKKGDDGAGSDCLPSAEALSQQHAISADGMDHYSSTHSWSSSIAMLRSKTRLEVLGHMSLKMDRVTCISEAYYVVRSLSATVTSEPFAPSSLLSKISVSTLLSSKS